jgi:endonuclease/exonuclease/phosphatase family metal-dependent hydrolase
MRIKNWGIILATVCLFTLFAPHIWAAHEIPPVKEGVFNTGHDSILVKDIEVKVMTFNIRFGKGWDDQWNIERTMSVIRDAGPDFIGIQEVDREWSARSQFKDVVTELAEKLGMFYVFGPAIDKAPGFPGGKFGNAVLSRYPISRYWVHNLPGDGQGRGIVGAEIAIDGEAISFFTTHLGLSFSDRLLQMVEILRILEEVQSPVIITGDWNTLPDNEEVRLMTRRFIDVQAVAGKGEYGTLLREGDNVRPRIDFIFASPEFGVKEAEVIETFASDHLPVVSTLMLNVHQQLTH